MPDLVIVESPGKTRKIAQIFGSGQMQQAASSRLKLVGVGRDGDRAEALPGGEDHLPALGCGDGRSRGPGRGAQMADGRVRRGSRAGRAAALRVEGRLAGGARGDPAYRPGGRRSGRPRRRGGRPRRRSLPRRRRPSRPLPTSGCKSRCGSCGGAQQRWKVAGGYVQLCAAWPAFGGVAFEAGRRPAGRAAASGPDRRLGAVEPGGSTFALGACGWRREMRHFSGNF